MENKFSYDFSAVRVHTDEKAARSARDIGAAAYTVGRDIVFGSGEYAPATIGGARLLAHELAHVVQQGARARSPGAPIEMGAASGAAEHEAERVAGNSEPVAAPNSAPAQLQMQPAEKGAVPCHPDAHRVATRSVDVQPIFFRSNAADTAPTGGSFRSWCATANQIWGKLAVSFNGLSAVTITDAAKKTAGSTDAQIHDIMASNSGSGIQVFFVNNRIAHWGGAATAPALAKTVLFDGAASNTLLAHELGHSLGIGHPPDTADANTIMDPTGSPDVANSTRNTIKNYNLITWPRGGSDTCIRPDA